MKISIDYDLLGAIKDVKEPLHPLKIIRNQKELYTVYYPLIATIACVLERCFNIDSDFRTWIKDYIIMCSNSIGIVYIVNCFVNKMSYREKDVYASDAILKLKKLVMILKELNVNTNFEMLLKSELYSREVEPIFDDGILPSIVVNKYINIPTYDYHGEITETSILQEHTIGSKEYVLSIGQPRKRFRPVLVNANK